MLCLCDVFVTQAIDGHIVLIQLVLYNFLFFLSFVHMKFFLYFYTFMCTVTYFCLMFSESRLCSNFVQFKSKSIINYCHFSFYPWMDIIAVLHLRKFRYIRWCHCERLGGRELVASLILCIQTNPVMLACFLSSHWPSQLISDGVLHSQAIPCILLY